MKLINKQIFLIIMFVSAMSISFAQNVDEIIDKHIKAHGNIEKWDNLKSMKITGRFTAFSEENDFFAIKTNEGAYYSELQLGQHPVVEGFNGTSGWTIDPWQEILFPRELNKTEINSFLQKSEFFTPFYKYKEKGHEVEFVGLQNVDGIDMYAIKLTRTNGKTETWYLDANTYLEYKCESAWVDFAYPAPAESYFDDFRTIDGLVIPYFIERTFWQRDRILQIENIEFNPEIDVTLFEIPRSKEISKLDFLAGSWDVKVDIWTRRGSWYTYDSTNSIIKFIATNMLEETIKYSLNFAQSKIIRYSYNSDIKNYLISVYNNFSSDIKVFQGNFTDSTFVVERTNLDCADTSQSMRLVRYIIGQMEEDSFNIEIKSSNDNGVTWKPQQKLSYTRKEK